MCPRITDLYAALPGITGKLELEYEGELRGADAIVREILRNAVARVYDKYFSETNTQQGNTQQSSNGFIWAGPCRLTTRNLRGRLSRISVKFRVD